MKLQTITRKNLQIIYNSVCQTWQNKITELLKSQQFNELISVEDKLLTQAFNEADSDKKKMLKKYFKFPESIIDRVKNFNDILKLSDKTLSEVIPYLKPKNKKERSLNAFAKIQLISEVLNQGWKPNWNNSNENKYYPYFIKNSRGWSVSSCDYWSSIAGGGFGSYYQTSELALFAGKTFIDIYSDYLPE